MFSSTTLRLLLATSALSVTPVSAVSCCTEGIGKAFFGARNAEPLREEFVVVPPPLEREILITTLDGVEIELLVPTDSDTGTISGRDILPMVARAMSMEVADIKVIDMRGDVLEDSRVLSPVEGTIDDPLRFFVMRDEPWQTKLFLQLPALLSKMETVPRRRDGDRIRWDEGKIREFLERFELKQWGQQDWNCPPSRWRSTRCETVGRVDKFTPNYESVFQWTNSGGLKIRFQNNTQDRPTTWKDVKDGYENFAWPGMPSETIADETRIQSIWLIKESQTGEIQIGEIQFYAQADETHI